MEVHGGLCATELGLQAAAPQHQHQHQERAQGVLASTAGRSGRVDVGGGQPLPRVPGYHVKVL